MIGTQVYNSLRDTFLGLRVDPPVIFGDPRLGDVCLKAGHVSYIT